MKLNFFIFPTLFLLILSCKTNKLEDESFIETTPFSVNNYYRYLKKSEYHIGKDSFKAILYSNVKPMEENRNIPEKIFGIQSQYDKSKKYFVEKLKGKSISYLEKKNKIVFRHVFQDYKDIMRNDTHFISKRDVINYLDKKKINYIIIKSYKKSGADILDLNIDNHFARIVTTSNFCESYSCYDLKDSINIENYRTIIANFYR